MQRAGDWLAEARAELRAARDLLTGGHWSWCCFTCHQAAEKALKAVCDHRRIPQAGHNLNVLLRTLEAGQPGGPAQPVDDVLRAAAARLNRLYIPTRYPDAFDRGAPADQFVRPDAEDAVRDAAAMLAFAEGIVGGR